MSSAITRNNTAEFVNTSGDTMTGPLLLPDGSVAAPALAFSSDADGTGTGLYRLGANEFATTHNGAIGAKFSGGAILTLQRDTAELRFGASSDLTVARDAANTLAQRNGTSAQTFRIYNTYTDAANYERISLGWVANSFLMNDEYAGTGLARKFGWAFNGSVRWEVTATAFQPGASASYDIGSDTLRARSLYLSGGVTAGIVTKTANYTATANDYTILVDATAGNVTITLPPAASHTGRIYTIKKIDASANTVSVDGDGAETIDGAGLLGGWNVQWRGYTIQSNGTSWFTISAKV